MRNENTVFRNYVLLVEFRSQIELDTLMIADSALYSATNIALMKNLKWLCRVPLTVQAAKQHVLQLSSCEFIKSSMSGYSFVVKTSNYGGVEQRWLIVESKAKKEVDWRQLQKRISKMETTAQKKLQKLKAEEFAYHQDAMKVVEEVSKQLKHHRLSNISPLLSLSEKICHF